MCSFECISSLFGVDELSRRSQTLLQRNPNGPLLELRPLLVREPIFECPFNFLQCHLTFTDQDEWFQHSLGHFGNVGPPASNQCPFCDQHLGPFTIPDLPIESWTIRMMFVSSHHRRGQRVGTARLDSRLIHYLWENRLIDRGQYRNLRCCSESQTTSYTLTESRRSRPRPTLNPLGN